jgi:hypothetical protein
MEQFRLIKGASTGGGSTPPPNVIVQDTYYGLVTYWANSPPDEEFITFDGAGTRYWGIQNYSGLGGTGASYNSVVFGVWINCTNNRDKQVILSKNWFYAYHASLQPFELYLADGVLTVDLSSGVYGYTKDYTVGGGADLRDSEWHHVGVNYVFNDPTSEHFVKVYVDGVKVAEELDVENPIANNNSNEWSIGNHAAYYGGGVAFPHGFFGRMYQPRMLLYDHLQGDNVLTNAWNLVTVPDP